MTQYNTKSKTVIQDYMDSMLTDLDSENTEEPCLDDAIKIQEENTDSTECEDQDERQLGSNSSAEVLQDSELGLEETPPSLDQEIEGTEETTADILTVQSDSGPLTDVDEIEMVTDDPLVEVAHEIEPSGETVSSNQSAEIAKGSDFSLETEDLDETSLILNELAASLKEAAEDLNRSSESEASLNIAGTEETLASLNALIASLDETTEDLEQSVEVDQTIKQDAEVTLEQARQEDKAIITDQIQKNVGETDVDQIESEEALIQTENIEETASIDLENQENQENQEELENLKASKDPLEFEIAEQASLVASESPGEPEETETNLNEASRIEEDVELSLDELNALNEMDGSLDSEKKDDTQPEEVNVEQASEELEFSSQETKCSNNPAQNTDRPSNHDDMPPEVLATWKYVTPETATYFVANKPYPDLAMQPATVLDTNLAQQIEIATQAADLALDSQIADATETEIEATQVHDETDQEITQINKTEVVEDDSILETKTIDTDVAKPDEVQSATVTLDDTEIPCVDSDTELADPSQSIPKELIYPEAPSWAQNEFDVLLFDVCGLKLAVPMDRLGRIIKVEHETHHIIGKPDWFIGTYTDAEHVLHVVDTAKFIMPEKGYNLSENGFDYIIQLQRSGWALACKGLQTTVRVSPDEVKWRQIAGKRPWLAGTVVEQMCALIHVDSLVDLLEGESPTNH